MLRKEDVVMVGSMLKIQKMVSFMMNIKPDPDVLRKLTEQENKIKYDKNLSAEQINTQIKNSGLQDKQAAEKAKADVYNTDAKKFTAMVNDFLENLPSNPTQAAQLIHYCSLRLFNECHSLDDTLPYNSQSFNQQRCALFEDALKKHVSDNIKNSDKPEKNTKYWVEILDKASEYKNSTVISSIHNGLQNIGQTAQSKAFKSEKLKTKYDSILDKQHTLTDGSMKSLKDIMGNVNYSDKFQPTPPPLSYFGSYVATHLGGKFDTQKQVVSGGLAALDVINNKTLIEKNVSDLVEIVRSHEKEASNMSWHHFIQTYCKNIVNDVQENQRELNRSAIETGIEKCLIAIKAISLQREPQKNIDAKGGSIECLKKSIHAKQQELTDLENKKQNLITSVATYNKSSNQAATKLFPDAGSSLNYLHRACIIPDTDTRNQKLNNFISDYKNIPDDIKNTVKEITQPPVPKTPMTPIRHTTLASSQPKPQKIQPSSTAIQGQLKIGKERVTTKISASSLKEDESISRKNSFSSSDEKQISKEKISSFSSKNSHTRLFDPTSSLSESSKSMSRRSTMDLEFATSEESEKEKQKSENISQEETKSDTRKRKEEKGTIQLEIPKPSTPGKAR